MIHFQRLTIVPTQISNQQIALTAAQQHYLVRVLRLRAGDRFIAIDGQGQGWLSVLQESLLEAKILESVQADTELPIAVTLLIALPKTGMDDVVRQATELGVSQIVPILSNRALLKPSSQKLDRWQRVAQEASEQCERHYVPAVQAPQSWTEALQTWNAEHSLCYICTERGGQSHLLQVLTSIGQAPTSLTLATGCEGGWTDAEIEQAIGAGYQPVSLGARILRAVTAPLVALSLVASVFESLAELDKTF